MAFDSTQPYGVVADTSPQVYSQGGSYYLWNGTSVANPDSYAYTNNGVAASGGSGGGLGSVLGYAPSAGASNNVNPPGFSSSVGRLEVDLTAGSANWTGLAAGGDGQLLIITVTAPNNTANTLTLNKLNAGSSAANQFRESGDMVVTFLDALQLRYYAGSVNKWVVVP